MNNYREMILLSLDEYNRMRKNVLFNKPNEGEPSLQKELNSIQDQFKDTLPDDQLLKLEGEVIQKHTSHILPSQPAASTTTIAPINDDAFIAHFNAFPKYSKTKALQIYNHLKRTKRWNDLGEILDNSGAPIRNSNIVELINAVTTNKKLNRIPFGFNVFINLLETTNLPQNYLSAPGYSMIVNYKQRSQSSDSPIDDFGVVWEKLTNA